MNSMYLRYVRINARNLLYSQMTHIRSRNRKSIFPSSTKSATLCIALWSSSTTNWDWEKRHLCISQKPAFGGPNIYHLKFHRTEMFILLTCKRAKKENSAISVTETKTPFLCLLHCAPLGSPAKRMTQCDT